MGQYQEAVVSLKAWRSAALACTSQEGFVHGRLSLLTAPADCACNGRRLRSPSICLPGVASGSGVGAIAGPACITRKRDLGKSHSSPLVARYAWCMPELKADRRALGIYPNCQGARRALQGSAGERCVGDGKLLKYVCEAKRGS